MRGKNGSVVIFLGDLPAQLTVNCLKAFVHDSIQADCPRGLRIGGSICDCTILRITDLNTGQVELRGLLEVRPALLAMQAIERLNGAQLLGQRITARRYRQRLPMRSPGTPADPVAGVPEQPSAAAPIAERRRSTLKIELAESKDGVLRSLTASLQRPWRFWSSSKSGSAAS